MNRFTFTFMNHGIDYVLDSYLNQALDSGIASVTECNSYYITIYFNDGSRLNAWNENKYYAWLTTGVFTMPNLDTFKWNNSRPKRKTMARLFNELKKVSY